MNKYPGSAYAGIDEVDVAAELRPIDELPEDLKPALTYWERIKPPGAVGPAWGSFDLLELPTSYLPTALVVDCIDDGERRGYLYRFWGSALTPVFGKDMTGKTFEDCPGAFRAASYATYDMVREHRAPCLIRFNARFGSNATRFQTAFRLPLSKDGETVSTIVSLLLVDYRKHEWEQLWN
ncbi:MAG: hypothetical protein JJ900_00300 [Rhodospirillales bacterium]|nr:hypothetical protein [Rhodospirillales bacterium]MBO6785256.1 hypothetical protein [Rhodospirillales bacterium]